MAKIALALAGLALVASQPAMAAGTAVSTVAAATDQGSSPDSNGGSHQWSHTDKIALSLAALTAVTLGIVAATNNGHGDRRPTSP